MKSDGPLFLGDTKKTQSLIVNPQVARSILSNGEHVSAGNASDREKPVVLEIAEPAKRGNPNSPAIILKQRLVVN